MTYKLLKNTLGILSSNALLLWLTGGWLMYYVSSAIWLDEAFAFFVTGVENNPVIQVPFVLFLLSGYLNMARVIKPRFRGSKIGFIGWLMLSLGVMLYFTGFFLSANIRQFDSRLIGEGDFLRFPWTQESYLITAVSPGLKEHYRKTDPGGFLEKEPKIIIEDSAANTFEIGAYPPFRLGRTYIHILNTGLAPGISLYKDNALLNHGFMALRLLPPGRSDYFELKPLPYRFLTSLLPAHTDHSGHHPEPLFDLKNPVYSTRVFKGEKVIAEHDSSGMLKFDEFSLQFNTQKYWVQLESAYDPGIPVMKYGIFIFVFGVPVYVLNIILSMLSFHS